jgi:hypothetical protein
MPGRVHDVNISGEVTATGEAGVDAFIAMHGLDTTRQQALTTTRNNACEATIDEFHRRYHEMYKFAILIGDFRSACLLDRQKCPINPFPLSEDFLDKYLQFKFRSTDEFVMDEQTGQRVVATDGTFVPCTAKWHSPTQVQKILAALTALHRNYESTKGPYVPFCQSCIDINNSHPSDKVGFYPSCIDHPNNPCLRPRGNVLTDEKVLSKIRAYQQVYEKTYVRRGTHPIAPKVRTCELKGCCCHVYVVLTYQPIAARKCAKSCQHCLTVSFL